MGFAARMRNRSAILAALLCTTAAHAEPLPTEEQKVGPTAFNRTEPWPVLQWGVGEGKSFWVPAGDILAFEFLLNQFDRHFIDDTDYSTNFHTFREHLTGKWVYDDDPFQINQFGHPYQGSMYHTFARSAGLSYWQSMAYTVGGSLLWETAGETTPPSINDQFTTGFGGTFLGEPLFRMASLVLESGGDGAPPGFWRRLAAGIISPATGINRWAYGERFDGVFRSHDPAVYTRGQLGVNVNSTVHSNVNTNRDPATPAVPQEFQRGEAIADLTIVYGLPGKPGYRYDRPFDYFSFQFTAATGNILENVISRGLLVGQAYGSGDSYRGVWGLYGTYDYIAPQIFRVSTTGAALGTSGQWWLSRRWALQGDVLVGGGYGSGGLIRRHGERDYHNGLTPQGMLAGKLIYGDIAAFDVTMREYYITDRASDENGGTENIFRGDAGLTIRVWGLHGLTLRYTRSRRIADYRALPDTSQTVGAVSLGYTYLGHRWFGAVDWREDATANK